MTRDEIIIGAKVILEKRVGEKTFKVAVDSPRDASETAKAFKKLGCRAKVESDGLMVTVTRSG